MPQTKQTEANRRTALLAAAQVYQGKLAGGQHVMDVEGAVEEMAHEFFMWLQGEEE